MAKCVILVGFGMAFGLLMASLMIVRSLHELLASSQQFIAIYDTIYLPAKYIALALVSLFAARDDGFMLLPVAVIVQWVGVGVVVWILTNLKPWKKTKPILRRLESGFPLMVSMGQYWPRSPAAMSRERVSS